MVGHLHTVDVVPNSIASCASLHELAHSPIEVIARSQNLYSPIDVTLIMIYVVIFL